MTSIVSQQRDRRAASATAEAVTPIPASDKVPQENKWLVSLAVIFGVLMSAIDTSVVNVALPDIQGNLGATQQEVTWISTGYMISVVILMPLTHWLSVRFGRKRIYLTSLVLFITASFMCGISHSLSELVVWRIIQGMGAGTLQPLAQAIFREAFPLQEQGMAMGLFGFVVLFGPAIGPTLGGYITDNYSWPWIFFINLPIGVIGFLVALRYLHDPSYERGRQRPPVDFFGIGLLAVGLATLQTVLEQGQEADWFQSSFICWLSLVAAVGLIGFVWWELICDKPAVDLRVLKNATFASGTVIGGVLGIGLFASLFLLPQFMQTLLGFTAMQSGLSLMPRSLAMMVMMPVGGMLYNRLGAKIMIGTGLLMTAYTQWIMGHFTLETGPQDILIPQVIQGIGFALVFVSLSTVALSSIPKPMMTSATGLNNLIRQLGGSFGTAYVVVVLTRHIDQARADLVTYANPASTAFMERLQGLTGLFRQRGLGPTEAQQAALKSVDGLIQQQAAMMAYDYIFLGIGVLFVFCIFLLPLLRAPKILVSADQMALGE
jgi:MFS transporter, DHA2 family, multidrug resistance protein